MASLRFAGGLLLAVLAGASAAPAPTPTAMPDQLDAGLTTIEVEVWSGRFTAVVVDTPVPRAAGLSGRDALSPSRAMWFDMGRAAPATFWMLGMRFPIDIVWIDAELRVVHVTHEAPVPPEGTSQADLPSYTPGDVDVRYVLEINAGLARELGIEPGVLVTLR